MNDLVFKRQKKPTLVIGSLVRLGMFIGAVEKAGYEAASGVEVPLPNEILSFTKAVGSGKRKQVHVQVVRRRDGRYSVYSHTEPSLRRPVAHLMSALMDKMSFSGGSKVLLGDLEQMGFRT